MTNPQQPAGRRTLPSREEWRRNYGRSTTRLMRAAGTIKGLTLTRAPADLGRSHLGLLLSAEYVHRYRAALDDVATAMDNLKHLTGYHHAFEEDAQDLRWASQHLRQANECLNRIEKRHPSRRGNAA